MVLVIFIFGLIFGSFINALVWRFHEKRKWWGSERSICPRCKHVLSAKDLVPVLSWVSLLGKCRYCKNPISVQYPLVELLTAGLFAFSYIFWPVVFTPIIIVAFVVWLFVLILLVALFVYDIKWFKLPNIMVATLTVATVMFVFLYNVPFNAVTLLTAIAGGVVFFGLFWGIFRISGGNWIGGGDVKMAFALGLIVGSVQKVLLTIFIASLIGIAFSLPSLANKKLDMKSKIPFGPCLILATILVFLFGQQIIDWYVRKILYV